MANVDNEAFSIQNRWQEEIKSLLMLSTNVCPSDSRSALSFRDATRTRLRWTDIAVNDSSKSPASCLCLMDPMGGEWWQVERLRQSAPRFLRRDLEAIACTSTYRSRCICALTSMGSSQNQGQVVAVLEITLFSRRFMNAAPLRPHVPSPSACGSRR